ncbi:MAG: PKD domain-containing protein [Methanoregula sp.]|nr:PKD domain-containing protein [Methanoregula sp.]
MEEDVNAFPTVGNYVPQQEPEGCTSRKKDNVITMMRADRSTTGMTERSFTTGNHKNPGKFPFLVKFGLIITLLACMVVPVMADLTGHPLQVSPQDLIHTGQSPDAELPANTTSRTYATGEIRLASAPVSAFTVSQPLTDYNKCFFSVANDAGVKYDGYGNNTYYVGFFGPGKGQNAHHITTSLASPYGQVTTTDNQTGVFYITDTGGSGYADNCILAVAVNGTIPDDFRLHIRSSGYNWTPKPGLEEKPLPSDITYEAGVVDEHFTKDDFIYGPQIWRPSGEVTPYPLYDGQDMTNTTNTFRLMFIDTRVGQLGQDTNLVNNGAAKIEYSVENLHSFLAFNSYAYDYHANQGYNVIAWTNRLMGGSGYSGYSVIPARSQKAPVAAFSANVTSGTTPLAVQFTDTSTGSPTTWAWDFGDDTNATGQNVTHTYTTGGTYTVNLTVANDKGTNTITRSDYITVSQILPDYNNIFVGVANGAGAKYNAFGNNTYYILFNGANSGLNALHLTTDPAVNNGQVTTTGNLDGTFYATDSGGKGYEDEIILLVAVNGTIPDNFRLNVKSDGYTWTPNPVSNQPPSPDNVTYQPVALNETFTKSDFCYGPQIWKPSGNGYTYPIYSGQNMSETKNTFQVMFIDLNAGVLRPNTALVNRGAVRINYSLQNLGSVAVFNIYAYCKNSNNGNDMVAWTNALTADKPMSGYMVTGESTPVAAFSANVTSGTAPLTVQFTDTSTGSPFAWNWSFGDGNFSTQKHPVYAYNTRGTYTVKLTVTSTKGTDSMTKSGYITVTGSLAPVAHFTANVISGTAPLTVTFTDESTNTPTSWAWDFGDGSSAAVQNPVFTYTSAGTFTVSLIATNAAGSNTTTKTGYISVSGNTTDHARLILPDASLYQNTPTRIPVRVTNITGGTGISFNLTYDPSVIRVNEITLNESYAPGGNLVVNATSGLIRISLTSTDDITIGAPVPVFLLNTTSTGDTGSSTPLVFRDARWSDGAFNYCTFDTVNGTALIFRHRGDLNGNGWVDIGDTAKTAYMVVGYTPDLIPDADFNNNGRIDVGDATKIARYLVGKIGEL